MADSQRIEDLKRRVHLDPASIAFAALAEEYRRAGRFEEAISTCAVGLLRHPSYLSAHVTLGRALIEVGRYEDAVEELQFVLRVAPENLAAIRGLADIHQRRGDVETPQDSSELGDPTATSAWSAASSQRPADSGQRIADSGQRPAASGPHDDAPPPAVAAPIATWQPRAAAPDPVIMGLEAFLAAIVRTRDARVNARR
jgi:tetratricopeptide (TPR) repeat protein